MMQPIIDQIIGEMHLQYENGVMKAVQECGFNVNKERLLQALTDARAFYGEGFSDGLREQQKWIPVTERLPNSLDVVFVRRQFGLVGVGVYLKGCGINKWLGKKNKVFPVTHWMPLPEPPKEG